MDPMTNQETKSQANLAWETKRKETNPMKKQPQRCFVERSWPVAVILQMLVASGFMVLKAPSAGAASSGYQFSLVSSLDSPAPGGGTFVNDFEPGGLNNRGDMAFGADVSTGGEGVFLGHKDGIIELGRTGGAAPGGGSFEFAFLGPVALNDQGDM